MNFQVLNNLKQIWVFKNKTNFLLFFSAFSSTGYFVARYINDQKFEHPVVQESTRLLQKNAQLIELVGYPIVVQSGLGSQARVGENQCEFKYKAKGPKGYVQIELESDAKTHQQIMEIAEKQKDIDQQNNKEIKSQYYILDSEIYKQITQMSSGNEENYKQKEIDQNAKFWKINSLSAELGGQYTIKVLPENDNNNNQKVNQNEENKVNEEKNEEHKFFKISEKEKQERELKKLKQEKIAQQIKQNNSNQLSLTGSIPYFTPTQRKTINDLLVEEKRRQGNVVSEDQIQNLNQQELEEMRKFKMQQFYQKLGYIRFYMSLVMIGGAMGGYTYMMRNKRININGSQIHMYTNQMLQRHPFIKSQLGNNIKFSQNLRGQQVGNEAEFENDLYGEKARATAKVKGVYNEKTNEWKITNLDLNIYDFNGKMITLIISRGILH
ncbi:hypothetical protein PPERSA_07962 [Pseudocohnilembus persalinus]|uniref:Transmembrane protein n=1 Tax=Pseudocohnilembus persalinus TaxID=266149 RepID=A0A0V0QB89_PSEPJ|nr:hypothetical protein PPERSA_07962 [Pseudocohnilembus persalinus]|eukprot:KRW99477.1 hypothetical protein PPERSA_07962 [Pseudocohnilembus persalinus]